MGEWGGGIGTSEMRKNASLLFYLRHSVVVFFSPRQGIIVWIWEKWLHFLAGNGKTDDDDIPGRERKKPVVIHNTQRRYPSRSSSHHGHLMYVSTRRFLPRILLNGGIKDLSLLH